MGVPLVPVSIIDNPKHKQRNGETLMRRTRVRSAWAAILGLIVSVSVVLTPGVANAAPSIPPLSWLMPVNAAPDYSNIVTSPNGNVTVGCSLGSPGQDLITYGTAVRSEQYLANVDDRRSCKLH